MVPHLREEPLLQAGPHCPGSWRGEPSAPRKPGARPGPGTRGPGEPGSRSRPGEAGWGVPRRQRGARPGSPTGSSGSRRRQQQRWEEEQERQQRFHDNRPARASAPRTPGSPAAWEARAAGHVTPPELSASRGDLPPPSRDCASAMPTAAPPCCPRGHFLGVPRGCCWGLPRRAGRGGAGWGGAGRGEGRARPAREAPSRPRGPAQGGRGARPRPAAAPPPLRAAG